MKNYKDLEIRLKYVASLLKNTNYTSVVLDSLTYKLVYVNQKEDNKTNYTINEVLSYIKDNKILEENKLKFEYKIKSDSGNTIFVTDNYKKIPFGDIIEDEFGEETYVEEGSERYYIKEDK